MKKLDYEYIAWYFRSNPNKTMKEIAEDVGCSISTVSKATDEYYDNNIKNT